MNNNIQKLLFNNLSISYIANIFTVISALVSILLITKYAGVEIYGILSIIMATSGILINVFSLRTSEAIVRFIRSEEAIERKVYVKLIVYIGIISDLLLGVIIVGVFYSISDFIAEYFIKDISYSDEVFIYSILSFLMFLGGTPAGYLKTKEMFVFINKMIILESILKTILLLGLFFILNSTSLFNIILVNIISLFITIIIKYIVFYKEYFNEYGQEIFTFNKILFREYFNFVLKTFTSSLLKAGNHKVDTLILAFVIDVKTVGVYEIVKKIVVIPINFISMPLSMLYYPKLVSAFKLKNIQDIRTIIFKTTFIIVSVCLFILFIEYIVLSQVLGYLNIVFSEQYYMWLLLLFMFYVPVEWWSRIFSNSTNPVYSIYSNLTSMIYSLTVLVFFAYYFGIIGFLWALLVIKILIFIMWAYFLRKELVLHQIYKRTEIDK